MKQYRLYFLILLSVLITTPSFAAYEGESENEEPGAYEESIEKQSGWFMGTDQGVMFFVGNANRFANAQYYGTIYGGYNIKGYLQPMLRIGQAFGSLQGFGNPSSFWLIVEGGFRVTPLRTKIRPFFLGTIGFYYLNVANLGNPVRGGNNLTFAGGGGLEIEFGRSILQLGSAYRGFRNTGPYLQAVEITIGYQFEF